MASAEPEILELGTPRGLARAHVHAARRPVGALVLGHGAGGSVAAPDLTAVTAAAGAAAWTVVLVEQPYRVAGRRSAAPAVHLDAAWRAVVAQLRAGPLLGLELIAGGRSSGARVACRTAHAVGAAAVLCLAFPLLPPRRPTGVPPASRQAELDAVGVPVLLVQGRGDHFGMPPPGPLRSVVALRGDHRLASDLDGLAAAVGDWLAQFGAR